MNTGIGIATARVAQASTFLYHEVVDDPGESGFQRPGAMHYKHTVEYFRQNLDAIAVHGRTPRLVTAPPGEDQRVLMLTFDDGGVSAMRIADMIEDRGWRGHFFITTSMIGDRHFLSADQIVDLSGRGHVIGAHSHTHPDIFRILSDQEMLEEWTTSCEILGELLGGPIETASIPGGDMDRRCAAIAGQAGIRWLFTSEPTVTPWQIGSVTCFGRTCPKKDTPLKDIGQFADFKGYGRARLVRRTKNLLRVAMDPLYRVYVARRSRGASL